MFDKTRKATVGYVFEIRDLIQDEAIIPQFCSKTEENAKRQFAIFLSQNKFKPCDFELNCIGQYDSDISKSIRVCKGSEVMISDYIRDDFEATESKE